MKKFFFETPISTVRTWFVFSVGGEPDVGVPKTKTSKWGFVYEQLQMIFADSFQKSDVACWFLQPSGFCGMARLVGVENCCFLSRIRYEPKWNPPPSQPASSRFETSSLFPASDPDEVYLSSVCPKGGWTVTDFFAFGGATTGLMSSPSFA